MANILEVLTEPHPLLHQKSELVAEVNDEIRKIIDDMVATMIKYNGIGLAAVQVGILKKIVVIQIPENEPLLMVNPEIISTSDDLNVYKEGCLSFPNAFADVTRPKTIKVIFLDYDGNKKTIDADGLLATCIQHEIDHTNGIVFVDHISKLKKSLIIKKVQKQKKLAN